VLRAFEGQRAFLLIPSRASVRASNAPADAVSSSRRFSTLHPFRLRITPSFFARPAEVVAPELIGCLLVKCQEGGELL